MAQTVDWVKAFQPLLELYGNKKHPLNYRNRYQLLVMVVLSAQSSDKLINENVAPAFFTAYPTMSALAKASPSELIPLLRNVRNFGSKAEWLVSIAAAVKSDDAIPHSMKELTALPGIGRKSANVIIRESGEPAEGIIVDLHVIRVAPRLGVVTSENPVQIEKQLMKILPQKIWGDIGMDLSFLGREICRPTNPKCEQCVMKVVCEYYKKQ
ncbi:MAG: endonuclease III [Bacteroidota bacterium]|nr:endonuclease III [Bacteroidota bacterium]